MTSLFDLPVFQGPEDDLITGHKRATLKDPEAQRRWDYFFRATPGAIEQYFFEEKTEWRDHLASGWEKRGNAIVGLLILVAVPAMNVAAVWFLGQVDDLLTWARGLIQELDIDAQLGDEALIAILLIPLGIFVLIGLCKYLPRLMQASSTISEAKRQLRRLKNLIRDLIKQVPRNTPSDQEMIDFVEARLADLERRAKKYLRLNQSDITIEVAIPPIQEWAYFQPQDKPGYSSIDRENPEFLKSVRITDSGMPVYAVYYIQYMFPTKDYIAVHGEFYDAISDDTRGKVTDEYYYADVTSIRTEVSEVERKLYFSNKILEVLKLRLTVASGDAVEVRMRDERILRTLGEDLENRRKANIDRLQRLQASMDNASREERVAIQQELEEAASARQQVLRDDRASFAEGVVRDIRHQLRLKKGTGTQ